MTRERADRVPNDDGRVYTRGYGSTPNNAGGGAVGRSFIYCVLLPTLAFWLYSAFWQSHRYVAETRLTVRSADEPRKNSTDSAAGMTSFSGGASKSAQDTFMVLNYIKSRALVVDIGGRDYLEKKFSSPEIDFFSRLETESELENIWKYWQWRVTATIDTVSSILAIRVEAFNPQDAFEIANKVVNLSEELVNQITIRRRSDKLARAEKEVELARQRLTDVREKVLQFRNKNVVIDPASRAASISETIGKLTLDRANIINDLATAGQSLSADAPSQRLQRTRLATIEQQLTELRKKLADTQGKDTVSGQMAVYESLKLDEQFAEKLYTISTELYVKARQELEKQQLYLITIVAPSLPEAPLFPRVLGNTVLVFCSLTVVWAVLALLVASINDQVD